MSHDGAHDSPAGAVSVRIGSVEDLALVRTHRDAALAESQRYRGRTPSHGIDADNLVSALGPNHDITVLVIGRVGSSDVGSLMATVDSTESASDQWLIGHVFVEEDFREVGVADAMLTEAVAQLRQRQAQHVRAYAQPGDRSLKNLFERHGLVAETITVGRSLAD